MTKNEMLTLYENNKEKAVYGATVLGASFLTWFVTSKSAEKRAERFFESLHKAINSHGFAEVHHPKGALFVKNLE